MVDNQKKNIDYCNNIDMHNCRENECTMFLFLLQNLPSLEAIFWAEPNSALHGIYVRPSILPTNENFHKYLVLDYNLPYIPLSENLLLGEKIIY